MIAPPGWTRDRATDRYQFQIERRFVGEWASSKFLCGSSMMSRSALRPVIGPPAPEVHMPPPPVTRNRLAADESPATATPRSNSSMVLRTSRPHSDAYSAS
jgi:hypothetical protein